MKHSEAEILLAKPGKGWSLGKHFVPRDICKICGEEFYCNPKRKRRAINVYCSYRCSGQAKRKPEAAKAFRIWTRTPVQRSFDMRRLRPAAETVQLVCLACKQPFIAKAASWRFDGTKYCSRRCFGMDKVNHVTISKRGLGGKRADLGNTYFRSKWEANWARYLEWMKGRGEIIDWKFEPDTFEFKIKRGSKFYTPDFKVITRCGTTEYHEVKGWMDQKSATKLKRMARYYPEVKIVLVDEKQYREVKNGLCKIIPGWE